MKTVQPAAGESLWYFRQLITPNLKALRNLFLGLLFWGIVIGANFKTAAYYFHHLREIIVLEVDESYFGGARKGKRGRGAVGKVPVFGTLKRGGKVYTQVIPNANGNTLIPIISDKVQPDSIVYSDGWLGYNALHMSEFKHYRVNHSKL